MSIEIGCFRSFITSVATVSIAYIDYTSRHSLHIVYNVHRGIAYRPTSRQIRLCIDVQPIHPIHRGIAYASRHSLYTEAQPIHRGILAQPIHRSNAQGIDRWLSKTNPSSGQYREDQSAKTERPYRWISNRATLDNSGHLLIVSRLSTVFAFINSRAMIVINCVLQTPLVQGQRSRRDGITDGGTCPRPIHTRLPPEFGCC